MHTVPATAGLATDIAEPPSWEILRGKRQPRGDACLLVSASQPAQPTTSLRFQAENTRDPRCLGFPSPPASCNNVYQYTPGSFDDISYQPVNRNTPANIRSHRRTHRLKDQPAIKTRQHVGRRRTLQRRRRPPVHGALSLQQVAAPPDDDGRPRAVARTPAPLSWRQARRRAPVVADGVAGAV